MSELHTKPAGDDAPASREEIISALFAHMVVQQTNLCMMLLGQVPHPQTGKVMHDIESAKLLIDQLEMIEEKTKGNLTKEETGLLHEAQTALRMAFVEVVDKAAPDAQSPFAAPAESAAIASPAPAPTPAAEPKAEAPAVETREPADDSRKRFSKKY